MASEGTYRKYNKKTTIVQKGKKKTTNLAAVSWENK